MFFHLLIDIIQSLVYSVFTLTYINIRKEENLGKHILILAIILSSEIMFFDYVYIYEGFNSLIYSLTVLFYAIKISTDEKMELVMFSIILNILMSVGNCLAVFVMKIGFGINITQIIERLDLNNITAFISTAIYALIAYYLVLTKRKYKGLLSSYGIYYILIFFMFFMKKIKMLCLICCFFMLLGSFISVYAEESTEIDSRFESMEQYLHAPNYYDENEILEREAYISTLSPINHNTRTVWDKALSITRFQQDPNYNYWCGPTAVQIVLKYKTGETYSQASLASDMQTTSSSGTYVYQIRNKLNAVLGSGTYNYYLITDVQFETATVNSIDADCPVICHANTKSLIGYGGAAGGHYVVAYGYTVGWEGSTSYDRIKYFDGWNTGNGSYGNHTVDFSVMETAIDERADYFISKG